MAESYANIDLVDNGKVRGPAPAWTAEAECLECGRRFATALHERRRASGSGQFFEGILDALASLKELVEIGDLEYVCDKGFQICQ